MTISQGYPLSLRAFQWLQALEAYLILTEYPAPEPDFMALFYLFYEVIKTKLTPENVVVIVAFSLANHNGEN